MTSARYLANGLTLVLALATAPARAQVGGDRFLGEVSSEGPDACPAVTLRFTVPIRFSGVANADPGAARLRVEPAVPGSFAERDLIAAPGGAGTIGAIAWERDAPGGATLIVTFTTPKRTDVTLGNDSQSLVLHLTDPARASGCAELDPPAGLPLPAIDLAAIGNLQSEAEDALLRRDDATAARALDRILASPDNLHPPRAIELRGLVDERQGAPDRARERYREYLRRFPQDTDAERVRQRLAGLPNAAVPASRGGNETNGRWRHTVSGSVSQFYARDTSRNVFIDARRVDPQEEIDRRVNIDQLLTTIDVSASASNGRTRVSTRVAGSKTHDFRPVTLVGSSRSAGDDTARLYTMYLDVSDQTSGLSGRLGRQSLFGSGVFGRFDGVRIGWQASPAVELHAQAGFPVYSTRTDRVIRDRRFYGFSVDYSQPAANYELSAYWFDQRSHGLVDRRAIGVEGRYTTKGFALFGLVDVDLAFGKLSHAFLSATVPMPGGATLSIQADQQYYPLLSLTNAVLGQPVPRLEELSASSIYQRSSSLPKTDRRAAAPWR